MSILYIKLKSVNNDGQFIDYKIHNIFKDINEMLDWFAYGFYINKDYYPMKRVIVDSDYNFRYQDGSSDYTINDRYENFLNAQNLTGFDTKSTLLYSHDIYIDFDFSESYQYLRENVLYDIKEERIMDIRNYAKDIISHINTAKMHTKWQSSYNNSLNSNKHRTHIPGYYYHFRNFRRELIDKTYYIDLDEIPNGINIKLYRQDNRFQKRSRGHKKPNSWKDKKVNKQWQWHKKCSSKSHYIAKSKYCDNSWINFEEEVMQ